MDARHRSGAGARRVRLQCGSDVEQGAIFEDGDEIEHDPLVEHGLAANVGVEDGHRGDRALWA